MVWPCVKPMRNDPCVTTLERARVAEEGSQSKSPLTRWRSGASERSHS
jgi:hypothetical protein